MLAIFATMAVIAAVAMFVPKREQGGNIAPDELRLKILSALEYKK